MQIRNLEQQEIFVYNNDFMKMILTILNVRKFRDCGQLVIIEMHRISRIQTKKTQGTFRKFTYTYIFSPVGNTIATNFLLFLKLLQSTGKDSVEIPSPLFLIAGTVPLLAVVYHCYLYFQCYITCLFLICSQCDSLCRNLSSGENLLLTLASPRQEITFLQGHKTKARISVSASFKGKYSCQERIFSE